MTHTTDRKSSTPAIAIATLALGTALAATPLAGAAPAAAQSDSYQDLYVRCMSGAPRSADGHEGWTTSCHRKVDRQIHLRECLSDAPATPDAREAWGFRCSR